MFLFLQQVIPALPPDLSASNHDRMCCGKKKRPAEAAGRLQLKGIGVVLSAAETGRSAEPGLPEPVRSYQQTAGY